MIRRTVVCKAARVGVFLCVSACGKQPTSPSTIQSQPPPASAPSPQAPHRTISGLVREVNGSGLSDVTIRAWSRTSRDGPVPIGSTAADGSFHFEQLAQDSFSFTKSGYEITGWHVPGNATPDEPFTIVVKMQPTLLLGEGRPIQDLITADDLAYSSQGEEDSTNLEWPGNVLCSPCKAIFLSASRKGGTLTLSSGGGQPLTMWVADYYSGPILVATGRPDEHGLVVEIPADLTWNTVLVGLDRRHDPPLSADMVIRFRVALADHQPSSTADVILADFRPEVPRHRLGGGEPGRSTKLADMTTVSRRLSVNERGTVLGIRTDRGVLNALRTLALDELHVAEAPGAEQSD